MSTGMHARPLAVVIAHPVGVMVDKDGQLALGAEGADGLEGGVVDARHLLGARLQGRWEKVGEGGSRWEKVGDGERERESRRKVVEGHLGGDPVSSGEVHGDRAPWRGACSSGHHGGT